MAHQHGQPQHVAGPFAPAEITGFKQLVDGKEIAQALAHFLAFNLKKAIMHPHIGHGVRAMGATGLSDLILMVREDQVQPAAMDIEGFAQIALGHGRAFDMPARTPPTPWTVPARLLGARKLPQYEIGGIALMRIDGNARPGEIVGEVAAGKLAVVGHGFDGEQHFSARLIGMAIVEQPLDHHLHFGDIVGGAWLDARFEATQSRNVLLILGGGGFGHPPDGLVQLQLGKVAQGARVDLVIHVGDVADIGDMVRAIDLAQQPEQQIEDDGGAAIADMGKVVNRRAAGIEPHIVRIHGHEQRLGAGQCVVKRQRLCRIHRGSCRPDMRALWRGSLSITNCQDEEDRAANVELAGNNAGGNNALGLHGAGHWPRDGKKSSLLSRLAFAAAPACRPAEAAGGAVNQPGRSSTRWSISPNTEGPSPSWAPMRT